MKDISTLFLRSVIFGIALIVLAICIFALPAGILHDNTGMYRLILLGLYIPAVPFFFALYQALKLLGYIDAGKAFSGLSVRALKTITRCAVAIAAVFSAGMPYIYVVADRDDAPGVVAIGLVIIAASVVVAVFAAVLKKLLQSAIALKAENDLTV